MSYDRYRHHLREELDGIVQAGLRKPERQIASVQGARIVVNDREVLNFCANNYLAYPEIHVSRKRLAGDAGLGIRPLLRPLHLRDANAAPGVGTPSQRLPPGRKTRILYSSCFDANGGLSKPCSAPKTR